MWLIFLLISFGYSLGLSTFEVLRRVCPVPPVVEFKPDGTQTHIFCQKCPPFTTAIRMGMVSPLNSTADFVVEYTLKVGNLWLAVYHSSECEPHSEGYGGYIVRKGKTAPCGKWIPWAMSEPICRRHSLPKSLCGSRHPKHMDIPLQDKL
jgi:hypothetical protein